MMNNRGFTLTELLVTIVIVIVLIGVAGYSLRGRMMGYKIENQVKQMYADLMNARARAMQQNRSHFVQVTAAAFQIIEDSDESGAINAGDRVIITRAWQYPSLVFPVTITMNTRGIIESDDIIPPADDTIINFNIGNNAPDYDCVRLFATRIYTGRMEGANCVVK